MGDLLLEANTQAVLYNQSIGRGRGDIAGAAETGDNWSSKSFLMA
jgi:hypothetical protein